VTITRIVFIELADESARRDANQRQLDQIQGQIFGEAMLDGEHQVVQQTPSIGCNSARALVCN
jgi:hypothetical protein